MMIFGKNGRFKFLEPFDFNCIELYLSSLYRTVSFINLFIFYSPAKILVI